MSDEPILEETTPNEEPSPLAEEATVEGRVQEIQASLRTIASSESMDKATRPQATSDDRKKKCRASARFWHTQ